MIAIAMISTRVLALVVVAWLLAASGGSASAGPDSRVAQAALSIRPPAYDPPGSVGRSHEFGSVYVTDAIGSADFNGDGLPDVVYTTANSGSTSTFAMQFAVNKGDGRFVDGGTQLFEGAVPRTQGGGRLVIADFNNDGRPDVYYADSGAEAAPNPPGFHDTLVLSTPDGKLVDATANIPQFHDFTHSAAAADVNGDGSIDLYVGNLGGGPLCCAPMLWLNDGTGHFQVSSGLLPASVADGSAFTASAFADVNGDGSPDLILGGGHDCPESPNPAEVLLNDGAGHFHVLPGALPPKPLGPTTETLDIKPVDLNNDGHVDLVVASTSAPVPLVDCYSTGYLGRIVQILINSGDGTFRDETASRLPQDTHLQSLDYIKNLTIADLNGDGAPDILTETVIPPNGDSIDDVVYLNDGNGAFRPLPFGYPFLNWHAHAPVSGSSGGRDVFLVQPSSVGDQWSIRRQRGKPLPPGPPAQTRVSIDPATGQLTVAWPYVWGATSYEVWRGGVRLGSTRVTRFVDATAVRGTTYIYTVRAFNKSGHSAFGPG
jgi:FG-GAP-like repeat